MGEAIQKLIIQFIELYQSYVAKLYKFSLTIVTMRSSVMGVLIGLLIGVAMAFSQGLDRLTFGNTTILTLVILNAIVFIFSGFIVGNAFDQKRKNPESKWFLFSVISSLILFLLFLIIFGVIERDFDFYGSIVVCRVHWDEGKG